MFDTTDKILRQLRAGEDGRAEFMEVDFGELGVVSPKVEDFAAEMTAFANGWGGTIFLGVNDEGSVVGVPAEHRGQVKQWVLNVATHDCDPPIRPEIRRQALPLPDSGEASVLMVVIPQGLFVHGMADGRYCERFGSIRRRLAERELAHLLHERALDTFSMSSRCFRQPWTIWTGTGSKRSSVAPRPSLGPTCCATPRL